MSCILFLEKHPESYLKSLRGLRGGGLWRDGRGRPALSAEGGWARRRPSPDEPSGGLESGAPAQHGASLRAVMGGACRAGFLGPSGTACRLIGEARRSWGTPTGDSDVELRSAPWNGGSGPRQSVSSRSPGPAQAGPDAGRHGRWGGDLKRQYSSVCGSFPQTSRFPSKLRGRGPLTDGVVGGSA